MTGAKFRLFRSRNRWRRLIVGTLALGLSTVLIARPDLWQYLTAVLVVHDLLIRLHGTEKDDDRRDSVAAENGGGNHDATGPAAESDAVRADRIRS
ncbi:hypothetical protein GCM10010448_54260 [Streptomyces glomeratus]|uniref:Uncharacterized protein n=1 Tax=Streptomyces glomeratus TaxID=284452 RepID=A0ABP6LW83_9ACTN